MAYSELLASVSEGWFRARAQSDPHPRFRSCLARSLVRSNRLPNPEAAPFARSHKVCRLLESRLAAERDRSSEFRAPHRARKRAPHQTHAPAEQYAFRI